MLRLRVLVVTAVALGVCVCIPGVSAAATLGPSGNAFYSPPSPLPAGNHGDLVWYRSAPVSIPFGPSANGWDVLYRSQSATGASIVVSGIVLVPTAAWAGSGPRPVVSYASGTQGLAESCAPSRELEPSGSFDEAELAGEALAKGWAVLITDYEGYINGGAPTYIAGPSEGHAVLDIVKAAAQIPGGGVSASAPVAIWGYSQGGGAAAWAGQLEPSYDPGLNLKGVAAGGVPADLTAVAQNLNANVGAGFLALAAVGLNNAYPSQIDLQASLNSAGDALVTNVDSICMTQAIADYAFQNIDAYTVGGETLNQLIATPGWRAVLAANKLGAAPIPVPLFQYHGAFDEFIPLAQAKTLAAQYCAMGVKVKFVGNYLGDHVLTAIEGAPDAVNWIAARFAGQSPPSTCT